MTKKNLIVVSIVAIILVAGLWVYALLHGPATDTNNDSFAEFGDGGDSGYVPSPEDQIITDVQINEDPTEKRLRQITTNPTAGAVFAENGIYYVEQGTGHLRHINLVTGTETLVSGKTIPGAYEAVFSSDGSTVAITTTQDGVSKTIVAEVPPFGGLGNLEGESLALGATEIDLEARSGTVFYLVKTANGSTGYSYDTAKRTGTVIFEIPLKDIHVLWGTPTYVYTTPTEQQTGYIYRIEGNELTYVTSGGLGLMAFKHPDGLGVTKKEGAFWKTMLFDKEDQSVSSVSLVPEKCTSASELYCAAPYDLHSVREFPDSWYKGTLSISDVLWHINADGSPELLSDFLQESGREIDVLKIGVNSLESHLFLINKNDNTLWLYRLPQ